MTSGWAQNIASPTSDETDLPFSVTPSFQRLYDLVLSMGDKCDKMEATFKWAMKNIVALQENSAQVKLGLNRLQASLEVQGGFDRLDEIQTALSNQTMIIDDMKCQLGIGVSAPVSVGAAVVKPTEMKTIEVNGELYQKV